MSLCAGVGNIALVIIFMFMNESVCHDHEHNHLNKKYGPYKVAVKKFEECRGPRPKNLTEVVLKGPYKKGNAYLVSLNFTVLQVTKIESMRMISYYIKDEVKNYVSTYRTQTPCTHFVLGPLIALLLNATSSCTAKPGVYVTEVDPSAYANKIFTSLIYGDYTSKIAAYNKKGNIACWVSEISIVPALK